MDRTRMIFLPTLLLAVLLTGCGGGGEDSSSAESSAAEGTSAAVTEAPAVSEPSDIDIDTDTAAKAAYEGLCKRLKVFAFDYEMTTAEVLKKKYPAAASAEGLDLSGERPAAEGDRDIYDSARESGITAGRVYADDVPSVRYVSPDGGESVYTE